MVTVKVGPEGIPFYFHRGFLCHYSAYFKAVLQGPFREADEGVIDLPDEDVKIIELFARWIYFNKFRGTGDGDGDSETQPCDSLTLMDASRL